MHAVMKANSQRMVGTSACSRRGRVCREDIGVDALSRPNSIEVDARGPFVLARNLAAARDVIVAISGGKRLGREIDEVCSAGSPLPGGGRAGNGRLICAQWGVKLVAGETPLHE